MPNKDYRKICLQIFGTDDVNRLKQIAQKAQGDNRNAGRKKKFNEKDIRGMSRLLAEGRSMKEIARQYGTSRQVVNKYLNPPIAAPYTARLCFMNKQKICTTIDVDFLHEKIAVRNRTDDMLHRAFGIKEHPDWNDFQTFLIDRCFPPSRGLMKKYLGALGLDSYDPLQIIEKTQGRTADDNMWIKVEYRAIAG